MSYRSLQLAAATVAVSGLLLSGCTADREPQPGRGTAPAPASAPALRLAAFDSCEALTAALRRAARDAVGPYGFAMLGDRAEAIPAGSRQAAGDLASPAGDSPAQPFSGTNTHEQGVDEPDIVKTDGRRIVTITQNVLRVVDAASRKETGRLVLDVATPSNLRLLVAGDTVLVLVPAGGLGKALGGRGAPVAATGPELLTVRLTGKPTLVSRYRLDTGDVVDARQVGGVARVVLRSAPRITMPLLPDGTPEDKRVQANRATIDRTPADAWLPGYQLTTDGRTTTGRVGCDRVSRPAEYSGSSLVTVLTFDLAAPALGDGDPVAVLADGDTVYGTGSALYVATDPRWRDDVWRDIARTPEAPHTDIYRFDVDGKARPVYAASGSVPGRLINQYALSEWDGHLRVATTTTDQPTTTGDVVEQSAPPTSSAIRVLRRDGGSLVQAGVVDGLGRGEQIYAVRYVGPRGYVVTFRQTDPLYAVDLSDPAKPAVTGELKITGYSAHLQSVGDGRLVGVGQEATEQGRTTGTQVSLFDVTDPRAPRRLAQQQVANGQSEAEYDPHALLWWPATQTLVVPVTTFDTSGTTEPQSAALVLRVSADGLTRVGSVSQPGVGRLGTQPTIRRSLMVGNTLWTLSDTGLQASDAVSLKSTGWLPGA